MAVSDDGWPIDSIDGTRCKPSTAEGELRTIPAGSVVRNTDDVAFGRILDHQMVEMGAIVTARNRAACVSGRSARLAEDPLPYHGKADDDQND